MPGSSTTQRFRYYEKRLFSGVRYTLNKSCSFDFSGGYAFDRTYNQGNSGGLSGSDQINVNPGPYLSGQVQLRW